MAAVALRMPSGYVPVEAEEMEYIEGGAVHIKNQSLMYVTGLYASIMISGGTVARLLAQGTAKFISGYIWLWEKLGSFCGGVMGALVGTVIGAFSAGSLGIAWYNAIRLGTGITIGLGLKKDVALGISAEGV